MRPHELTTLHLSVTLRSSRDAVHMVKGGVAHASLQAWYDWVCLFETSRPRGWLTGRLGK